MNSVLVSIQPRWCDLIIQGKKTIEIRKSKPKIETPFKCFIYCTKDKKLTLWKSKKYIYADDRCHNSGDVNCNGMIIGEFVCDEIRGCRVPPRVFEHHLNKAILEESCLSFDELYKYAGEQIAFAWSISKLKIYKHPLDISAAVVEGDCDCMKCRKCYWADPGNGYNVEDDCNLGYSKKELKPLFVAPQSWCYVEEVGEDVN